MRHGILSLTLLLCLSAIAVSTMIWFSSLTSDGLESLRVTRSEHQALQQQLSLLTSPDMQIALPLLDEDLDALRIRLVEALTQFPLPAGVIDVTYEQTIQTRTLEGSEPEPVHVLRMELSLVVQHSVGFLRMLERVDEASGIWPHDVRGCRIQRHAGQRLAAHCALNFYHWQADSQPATASTDRSESHRDPST